jgi:hypothetical protein
MGRKVVDATNACRIRRTRGESGLFFLFAVVAFEEPVFFAAGLLVDFFGGVFAQD